MKYILIVVSGLVLSFVFYGYFSNPVEEKWIGIGILLLTFVLIPLFLYYRLREKKNRDRMFNSEIFGNKKNNSN